MLGIAITLGLLLVVGLIGFLSPVTGHLRKAEQAFAAGEYEHALGEYDLALRESPDNWDIQVKIAEVYMAQKNFNKAGEQLNTLQNKDKERGKELLPLLAKVQLGIAETARIKSPYGSKVALSALQQAFEYDPNNNRVKQLFAEECYWDSFRNRINPATYKQNSMAEDELLKAISLDPKPEYKVELASRYWDSNKRELFEKTVTQLSPSDLSNENVRYGLALLYLKATLEAGAAALNNNRVAEGTVSADGLKLIDRGLELAPDSLVLLAEKLYLLMSAKQKGEAAALCQRPGLSAAERETLNNLYQALNGHGVLKTDKELAIKNTAYNLQLFPTDHGPMVGWIEHRENRSLVWTLDLRTGVPKKAIDVSGAVFNLFITKSGQLLYEWVSDRGSDGGLYLNTAQGPKLLYKQFGAGNMMLDKLSPDSRHLTLSEGESMQILSLEDKGEAQLEAKLLAKVNGVMFQDWSPDGTKLLVRKRAQGETLWTYSIYDLQGTEISVLPGLTDSAYDGWSPEGMLNLVFAGNPMLRMGDITLAEIKAGDTSPQPLLDKKIYQGIMGLNILGMSHVYSLVDDNSVYFTGRALSWSPDGGYAVLNDGAGGAFWLLPKGKKVPLAAVVPGQFIGWSAPDKAVFVEQIWGPGDSSSKMTIREYKITLSKVE